MRDDDQPSVEEILRSIRQVIARDDRIVRADSPLAGSLRNDLTGREEGGSPPPEETSARAAAEAEPSRPIESPADNPQPEAYDLNDAEIIEEEPLVAGAAEQAMRESLSALSGLSAAPEVSPADNAQPLEAMVRELLRPMLKQWLDTNLPHIVEQVVQREIARITGRN